MSPLRATSRIEALSEGIIEAGWLLALGLIPLLFNIYSSRSYEPDKVALLRSLAVVMVAAWLWKVICGGRPTRTSQPLSALAVDSRRPTTDGSAANPERRPLSRVVRALFEIPLVPLVASLTLVLMVGSFLSVDSRLSWFGSYARAQGTWTQLTYLVVFAFVLTHLRTPAQWRRVVFTVIVASASISLYGIFQALGLDPVMATIKTRRVYSTLGNSIFLGAFLDLAFFLTALEFGKGLVEWWQRRGTTSGSTTSPGLRTWVVGGILLCQLTALVLSQSRGPFLGLLSGAYIFVLVGLLRLRRSGEGSPQVRRWRSLLRWAVPGMVATALITLVFLVVINMPNSPLRSLRNLPYVGRLGTVLDADSRSIQVRLNIWRSVSKLLQSGEPIVGPDGTPDRFHGLRPVIGTGPETLGLAINRFVDPKLGQLESVNKFPDRSHNETFDLVVMEGTVGTAIWLGIICSVCGLSLSHLGLIRSRAQSVGFWSVVLSGAMLGALAPWLTSGEATLSGVGLSVGLVLGLALFVTILALIDNARGERETGSPMTAWDWAVLALLATFVAHLVEIQVGIAITTTRLYFWFYAAVVVLAAKGWLIADSPAPSSMSHGNPGGGRRPGVRAVNRPTDPHSVSSIPRSAVVHSLIVGSLCIPWIFGMTLSSRGAIALGAILTDSWFGSDTIPTFLHLTSLSWLVLVTILVGSVLASPTGQVPGRRILPGQGMTVMPALGLVVVSAVTQAGRVAHVIERTVAPNETLLDAEYVADHFAVLVGGLVFIVLLIGALLSRANGERLPWTLGRAWLSALSGILIVAAVVGVMQRHLIDPVRADSLLNIANQFIQRGNAAASLEILDRAVALSPREPMFQLVRGSAALAAANTDDEASNREMFFDLSKISLLRALELAPLDPDHSANLARCLAHQARVEKNPKRKTELLARSHAKIDAALRLRPMSVVFLNESGRLLLNMGRVSEARKRLRLAITLDPLFTEPYLALAAIAERSAGAAGMRGEEAGEIRLLEEAADLYDRALEIKPELEPAQQGRERVQRAISSKKRTD